MSVLLFEGPAGSGKTYRLVEEVQRKVDNGMLREEQRVLGITFMHGSRRRLQDRLGGLPGLRGRFDSVTVDSLALRLVTRFRRLAERRCGPDIGKAGADFLRICEVAAELLQEPWVRRWIAARYPVVVADELQDCRGHRLAILRHLADATDFLAAGDDFQDLDASCVGDAVAWARGAGAVVQLEGNHRTSQAELLDAASRLRAGVPLRAYTDRTSSLLLIEVRSYAVAAAALSSRILSRRKKGSIAILTPSATDPFVMETIARLEGGPFPKAPPPVPVPWERSRDDDTTEIELLGLPSDDAVEVTIADLAGESWLAHQLRGWFERRRNLTGRQARRSSDVRAAAAEILHRRASFGTKPRLGRSAMTIHQAKNREFDFVGVLWPYRVVNGLEKQRRLLYNALTRARKAAVVLVQSGQPGRLAGSPFFIESGRFEPAPPA